MEVGGEDDVVGVLEQLAVALLAGPQRGIRLPEPPVRHLKRRQALQEEIRGGRHRPRGVAGSGRHDGSHRLIVNCYHLQHALPFDQRLAAKLVRALQDALAPSGQVILQRRRVLLDEPGRRFLQRLPHGRLPV